MQLTFIYAVYSQTMHYYSLIPSYSIHLSFFLSDIMCKKKQWSETNEDGYGHVLKSTMTGG